MSPQEPTPQHNDDRAPTKFRKKPVEIEAMHFSRDLSPAEAHEIYRWVESNTLGSFEPLDIIEGRKPYPAGGVSIDPGDGRMIISTLEGLHWVNLDDWIIRGVKGEFYPCKPDIFAATYDAVDDAAQSTPAVETVARWLGERESTHLWGEIHPADQVCYRQAAQHLIDTMAADGHGVGSAPIPPTSDLGVSKGLPGLTDNLAGQLGYGLDGLDGLALVAVQLPELMREGPAEFNAGCGAVVTVRGPDVVLCTSSAYQMYRSPVKARELAAALLAAAAHADTAEGAK